jgi:fatty acyl-CoA reductase
MQAYYKEKTIFITGTTGFVGKVVLEKILRSLPEFKRMYIMVRSKKGVTDQQRLNDIFKSELFSPYFKANPEMRSNWPFKCKAITGDLTFDKLGLSPEN